MNYNECTILRNEKRIIQQILYDTIVLKKEEIDIKDNYKIYMRGQETLNNINKIKDLNNKMYYKGCFNIY